MNLCADCANACGGCSWTALDPKTLKPMFKPVDGWDAEYVDRKYHSSCPDGSYDVISCPQYVPDPPRQPVELPTLRQAASDEDQDQLLRALAMDAAKIQAEINKKRDNTRNMTRTRRYRDGLCISCGIRPRRDGRTECEECARKRKEKKAKRKAMQLDLH